MKRLLTLVVLLAGASSPAFADFCMLTQNALHLGQGKADYKEAKRQALKDIFQAYEVVNLQEVMDPSEPARVAPSGFTATVSAVKGRSTYKEYYALLTRDAAIKVLDKAEYPDREAAFARPPFGIAVEDKAQGGARYWLVDIHAVFGTGGTEPRRKEVRAMDAVTRFYASRVLPDGGTASRVVVAGDWNLPTTDKAFADLEKAVPGTLAAPNVQSSLNQKGAYSSPYDHFVWNRALMNVDFAADPRDTGGLDTVAYRKAVSDHVGVAGYVMGDPNRARPEGVSCPPARAAAAPRS